MYSKYPNWRLNTQKLLLTKNQVSKNYIYAACVSNHTIRKSSSYRILIFVISLFGCPLLWMPGASPRPPPLCTPLRSPSNNHNRDQMHLIKSLQDIEIGGKARPFLSSLTKKIKQTSKIERLIIWHKVAKKNYILPANWFIFLRTKKRHLSPGVHKFQVFLKKLFLQKQEFSNCWFNLNKRIFLFLHHNVMFLFFELTKDLWQFIARLLENMLQYFPVSSLAW